MTDGVAVILQYRDNEDHTSSFGIFHYKNNNNNKIALLSTKLVMSSQITLTQSSNTHLLAHIPGTCALIYPNRIIQWYPNPLHVIIHQSAGGLSKKMQGLAKMAPKSSTYEPGLSTPSYLSRIVGQPPPSCLCCPRTIFTPSIQPNLCLPSTRPPLSSTINTLLAIPYTLHVRAQTISILSDPLCSSTPFLYQLSYAPPHSQLYIFVTFQPNFSNTSSQEHSLSFCSTSRTPMPLLRTTPLVQLLIHIDTSSHLSPILYRSAHFPALPKLYTPHSFCVPHPFRNHTCDPRYFKQSTSSNGSPFNRAVTKLQKYNLH